MKVTVSQSSGYLGSRPALRKCILYVSILRTFSTKEGCPQPAPCLADGAQHGDTKQATRAQVRTCRLFMCTGAAMLTEACHVGWGWGASCQPGAGDFYQDHVSESPPSLTLRFWFIGSEVLPSPALINEHQVFNTYSNL